MTRNANRESLDRGSTSSTKQRITTSRKSTSRSEPESLDRGSTSSMQQHSTASRKSTSRSKRESLDRDSTSSMKQHSTASRKSTSKSERLRKQKDTDTTEKRPESLSKRASLFQSNGFSGKPEFQTWGGTNLALFLFCMVGCFLLTSWSSRGARSNLRKFSEKRHIHDASFPNTNRDRDAMPYLQQREKINVDRPPLQMTLRGSNKGVSISDGVSEAAQNLGRNGNKNEIQSTNEILRQNLDEEVWNSKEAQYLAATIEKVSPSQMKAAEGEKTELTNKATQRHDAMEESATNFHIPEEVATTSTEEGRKVSWPDPEINKRYEEWKKAMNASNENTGATNYELAGKTQEMMPRRQALDHRRGEMNTSTETTKAASTNLPSTIQKTQTERSTISRQTKRSLPTEVSTNANTNKLSVTDNENTSPSRHLLGVATPFVLAPFVLLGILGYAWWNNSFSSIP